MLVLERHERLSRNDDLVGNAWILEPSLMMQLNYPSLSFIQIFFRHLKSS